MAINFNTDPYYDDYNESKQFYRILFRPGRAVQARELTQLQTSIQAQIDRFGKGIYKNGSFVTPPKETYDPNYNYVKLQTTYNSVDADSVISTLIGQIVVGQTTGVRATVINSVSSTTSGDPPTIYVKYLNSGTDGETNTFADNEIITNTASTISIRAVSSSATGKGTAYSVGTCVMFAKGNFLYVEEQTLIAEKYSSITNAIIGFLIAESIITSDDDDSLLDPAITSYNYFAPGADRYKINLTLEKRALTSSASDDPNFVEILRIENSDIISKKIDPELSVLGDTLARRTFDESGNYVVNPFGVELLEHLRSNAITNVVIDAIKPRDGLYTSANGGDESLFVVHVSPGKAYIKGYEVANNLTRYINVPKARDSANVTGGTIATQLCSYINVSNVTSVPTLSDIPQVEFYNKYTATASSSSGTKIGTARVRNIEYVSGNTLTKTAVYKLYLFDTSINDGYTFEKDAKQVYINNAGYADFTGDITPTYVTLSGSASFVNASNVITGTGTRFTTEVRVGDYITISNNVFQIASITNDVTLIASANASATANGFPVLFNTSKVFDADKDTFIIPFPYEVIKTVDPNNNSTDYTIKRFYSRSLTAGAVTINAGTDETFTSYSAEDYQVIGASGTNDGNVLPTTSSNFTRAGTPTGSTLTVDVSGLGLTTETVKILTTVRKIDSAAVKKTKTLVSAATVDKTAKADAQATTISLGKADGYKLNSVKMANVAFGSSWTSTGAVDITSRYTFDNGQKATYYDLAKIVLKPGQPKPTGPIRIDFDYFTHGTGDYFSADSYSGISYKLIPEVTIGTTSYKLRDCLDFRPRINDAGTGFTGSGSSTTEFIDPEIDFQTDYQYYLPRIDVIGLDQTGAYIRTAGISSLNPVEPNPPSDLLSLFVLKQKPYVFDLISDIDVVRVENKRYTMKDIGKLENRVKTLEYYTSLSLLERDAQQEQIQDELGFERFKNGFLVDSFTGHGVGDSVENPDYAVSVNYKTKEASPLVVNKFINLTEASTTNSQRSSNNYVKTGELLTLPFTETTYLENKFASKSENLNPFNVVVFNGVVTLDPPGDLWFEDTRVPEIIVDQTGDYDSLRSYSLLKKDGTNVFGSINNIEQFRNGVPSDTGDLPNNLQGLADLIGAVSPSTSTLTLSGKEVVKNVTVIPKMRSVNINFSAQGLRPNTRVYAFFEDLNVTNYCSLKTPAVISAEANLSSYSGIVDLEGKLFDLANAHSNTTFTPLITDASGDISGVFHYFSNALNLSTGVKLFRLSNSKNNDRNAEGTYSEAYFYCDGLQREIADEVLRPPPPPPKQDVYYDPGPSGGYYDEPTIDRITEIYQIVAGRAPDPEGYAYWVAQFGTANPSDAQLQGVIGQSFSNGFIENGSKGAETGSAASAGLAVSNGNVSFENAASAINRIMIYGTD